MHTIPSPKPAPTLGEVLRLFKHRAPIQGSGKNGTK